MTFRSWVVDAAVSSDLISLTSFLDKYYVQDEFIEQVDTKVGNTYFDEAVEARPHNPISFEYDIIQAVKNGDEEALHKALNSPFASMRGTLAKDELRSQKNLAIVDMTIVQRAMIDEGYSSEETFILGDSYIRHLEEVKDVEEAQALSRVFALKATQMMKDFHARKLAEVHDNNHFVELACEYIDHHAFNKLSITHIAKELNISKGYLSRLFRAQKGMTIGDYIMQKKINIAAIILANTNESIDDIAHSLSFCSQSYFGKAFLEHMGCTPLNYRKKAILKKSHKHS